jgi:hypothetical protein
MPPAPSASRKTTRAKTTRPPRAMTQKEMEDKRFPQSAIEQITTLQLLLVRSRYLYQ